MTAIHETAYPRLKTNFTDNEIKLNFKPSEEELLLMRKFTQAPSTETQLGFLIMLKCYQCLGRPIAANKAPFPIKLYIANSLDIDIYTVSLAHYDKSKSRKRHINTIRKYLQINVNEHARKQCLKKAVMNSAATKENLADIINDLLDELVKSWFELPAFDSLLRLARAARVVSNNHYYNKVSAALSEESKAFLDDLFITSPQTKITLWNKIKQDPKNPTAQHVKTFINHLDELKNLRAHIDIDINFIPVRRIEHFVSEAMSLDAADMRKIKPYRRYCLAAILVAFKVSNKIDDIVSILIRWIRKLHTDGSQRLNDYRLKHSSETDDLISLLQKILIGLKSTAPPSERLLAIENSVTQGTDKAIKECEGYMIYSSDNYFPFMLKPYSNKHSVIFELIEQLDIQSSSQDNSIIKALEFIKAHKSSHKEWLNIEACNQGQELAPNLDFLSDKWIKLVTGKTKGQHVTQIHRKYYELAVLSALIDDLDCSDVYVEGANIYDDPNKQLISWKQFYEELEEYCALTKIPSEQKAFILHLQKEMREAAHKTNEAYPSNKFLHIEKGLPVLKKSPAKEKPCNLEKISQMIAEQMPLTNIVEIMVDVEKWLNLSACFKPLSGYETKISNYKSRFVATSFSYGCNVGPTESERCLPEFSRKQIAWLFNRHITETKLEKAITKTINRYNKFELPKNWGTGESVSTDGTYCDMYQQNLMAEYHIRYGNYGGLGYYHVSDLYIALYSNFIPCGVYEGNYIFDALIANESEVKPNKVHGDTGVQSEVIFGVAFLLAIQLMPRIRNFKHLRYYKATKGDNYNNIDELFTDENIDWNLIKRHYYDMLRLIMSIRAGRIKASTILRKLNSKSRKNKLYFAFRELGRVVRTIFLLNYINDVDLRRVIHAATCKSEEFNDFIKWIRFGGGGIIADNMRYNQRKIIKYGQLIANIVMLHVVANTTKVINNLRIGDIEIGNDILEHLSPFRTDHINRLGIFQLDIDKIPMELEYKLVKKTKE